MTENQTNPQNQKETKSDQGNLTAALTYLAGWITGLVFLLIEKEDDFVRFNAAQSLVLFGGLTLLSFVPLIGQLLGLILWPLSLVLWIVLMVKAYNNQKMELPVVSDLARQLETKISAQ